MRMDDEKNVDKKIMNVVSHALATQVQMNLAKQSKTKQLGVWGLFAFWSSKHLEMAFWTRKTHCIRMVLAMKIGQIGLARH